ncbi:MAG: hypothetical protein L3J93_02290 [Thermoplasmata archaeon]|nr:hypothetical protein [Thermoplasmata archaeon]
MLPLRSRTVTRSRASPPTALLATLVVTIVLVCTIPPRGGGPSVDPPRDGLATSHPAAFSPPGVMPSTDNALFVTTTDPAIVPNTGVETNITGFAARGLPQDSSFQVGVVEPIGAYDAVFGIFENTSFGPLGFFEVYTVPGNQLVHLSYSSSVLIVPGAGYEFRLATLGGTRWNLTVNGAPFASRASGSSFDFGVASATSTVGLSFSEVALGDSLAVVPPVVTATVALAFATASGWYLPMNGASSFRGNPSPLWGVQGRNQSGKLAPGEIRSGTTVPVAANGTGLWSGPPVPIQIHAALSVARAVATTVILANASVLDGSGRPLAGVPLVVSDALGGAEVSGVTTDASGNAQLGFLTPNVSKAADDLVRISSGILGYVGSAGTVLSLVPAVRLVITATPSSPTVAVGASIGLTLRATDAGGVPSPFPPFEFATGVGGWVSLSFGVGGVDGTLPLSFEAGTVPGLVNVTIDVIEPGVWGHLVVTVHMVRAPLPWYAPFEPELLGGSAIALLAALVVLLRRKGKFPGPLPPLSFLEGKGTDDGAIAPQDRVDPPGLAP